MSGAATRAPVRRNPFPTATSDSAFLVATTSTSSCSRSASGLARRVLADETVDGLADEVGVADVTCVLLDEVGEDAPQAGRATVRPRGSAGLFQAAALACLVGRPGRA